MPTSTRSTTTTSKTRRRKARASTDAEFTRSRGLAVALYRLMTDTHGVPLAELQQQLGLKERAFRNFRRALQALPAELGARFEIVEEMQGDAKCLRLKDPEEGRWSELTPAIGALHVSRLMMGFFAGTPLGEEYDRLAKRTGEQLRDQGADKVLANLDRKICYVPFGPQDYSQKGSIIKDVLHAVFFQHRLRVRYNRPTEPQPKTQEIDPFSVLLYQGALYVVARPVGIKEPRTFAMDRILEVEDLETKFEVPSDFSPQKYVDGCFGIYRSPDAKSREVEVVFAAKASLKAYVKSRKWHHSQRFTDLPDGRLRMTFRVNSLEEVARWVCSFGPDIEVVRPAGGWEHQGFAP